MATDNNAAMIETVTNYLQTGKMSIVFTKTDGSERTLECTLSPDLIPQLITEAIDKPARAKSIGKLDVYDLEHNAWKAFRWDRIKSVRYTA